MLETFSLFFSSCPGPHLAAGAAAEWGSRERAAAGGVLSSQARPLRGGTLVCNPRLWLHIGWLFLDGSLPNALPLVQLLHGIDAKFYQQSQYFH